MNMVRIWFTKTGDASYISLLDLQRAMGRCLKRSGLPVWYTMGFNPHIYMTFTCPLSLGQESLVESVDVKTEETAPDYEAWRNRLNQVMPNGVEVTKVTPVIHRGEDVAYARYVITAHHIGAKEAVASYNAAESITVEKRTKKGSKTIELKEILSQIDSREEDGCFRMELLLPSSMELNVNPSLLLDAIQEKFGYPTEGWSILRTQLYTKEMEIFC